MEQLTHVQYDTIPIYNVMPLRSRTSAENCNNRCLFLLRSSLASLTSHVIRPSLNACLLYQMRSSSLREIIVYCHCYKTRTSPLLLIPVCQIKPCLRILSHKHLCCCRVLSSSSESPLPTSIRSDQYSLFHVLLTKLFANTYLAIWHHEREYHGFVLETGPCCTQKTGTNPSY